MTTIGQGNNAAANIKTARLWKKNSLKDFALYGPDPEPELFWGRFRIHNTADKPAQYLVGYLAGKID